MQRRLFIIFVALLANANSALSASPEPPVTGVPATGVPATGFPATGTSQVAAPADPASGVETSTTCFEQSLTMVGTTASCDALIDQAQLQTPAPVWLASAHTSRGLIIARRATTQADPETLQAALRDHETAARLAPQRVEPQINQANVLLALGRAPEALALYDKIIAAPNAASQRYLSVALFNRAIAYRALGDFERAQASLEQARSVARAAHRQRVEGVEGVVGNDTTTPPAPR